MRRARVSSQVSEGGPPASDAAEAEVEKVFREQENVDATSGMRGLPATGELPGAAVRALAENEESVVRAIRLLSRMEQEGTLQELADVLALVKLVREALTDEMVIGAVRRIEALAAVAADPALFALAGRLPAALRAAEADAARATDSPPGFLALVRQMGDPQVRRGLAFFLSLAKHIVPQSASSGSNDAAR